MFILWGVTDIEVRWATMELLFHSLGIVVLMLFYMVSSNGNRMYNVRVLPITFRLRIYNNDTITAEIINNSQEISKTPMSGFWHRTTNIRVNQLSRFGRTYSARLKG